MIAQLSKYVIFHKINNLNMVSVSAEKEKPFPGT